MQIFDVSIPIKEGMTIYPNNPVVKISSAQKNPADSSNVSKIEMGSHTGTHLDAPKHVFENGEGFEAYNLSQFIGPAKVFDFSYLNPSESVKISDFEKATQEIQAGDRILLKTSNSERGYKEFYADFVYLDGDCAKWLADKGVSLVGIDYLSIKQKGSPDNRPHTELLSKNIAILEGINLKEISMGEYVLYAPPLKFEDIDGSPTRALLVKY